MKILSCHNYYQQRGGEDQSFEDEVSLLRERGDEVVAYTRHNDEIDELSKLSVAKQTMWSRRAARDVRGLLERERPDVMHCTNTFPLISPSVYREARRAGVPVVQSLRNYRFACLNSCFYRDGRVCEDCLGKAAPIAGVVNRCYRGSLAGSLVVAGMQTLHRRLGTWTRGVDAFYTLTEFSRAKCVEMGLPADRVFVKPNCVQPDPGAGAGAGGYAVFAARLTKEKGVRTLLEAWSRLGDEYPLKIIGAGPMEDEVARHAAACSNVEWLGPMPHGELLDVVGAARVLVVASEWYETFGRTIIEAYAKGTPVVASRLGAMAELVRDAETGMRFTAGDAGSLAGVVRRLWALPPSEQAAMRSRCRREYLARYTPDANYEQLRSIYRSAMDHHRNRAGSDPVRGPSHAAARLAAPVTASVKTRGLPR